MKLNPSHGLAADERGATIVEFALVLLPLCIVLIGFLDLGYQSYLRSVLQGGLNDVARTASVESPQFATTEATLQERVETAIKGKMGGLGKDGTFVIKTSSYYSFAGVAKPERLVTDVNGNGAYDSGDCWQDTNPNDSFDLDGGRSGIGGASDVVFYDVTLTIPRFLPMAGLLGISDDYEINATTAIRSQPYADQEQPEVEC